MDLFYSLAVWTRHFSCRLCFSTLFGSIPETPQTTLVASGGWRDCRPSPDNNFSRRSTKIRHAQPTPAFMQGQSILAVLGYVLH